MASRMAWQTRQDASLLCLQSIAGWRVRRRIGVNHTCPFRGPGAAPRIGPVMVGRPKGMRLEAPAHAGQALLSRDGTHPRPWPQRSAPLP